MLIPSSHLSFVNIHFFSETSSRTSRKNIKDNSLSGFTNGPPCIKRLKKTNRKLAQHARRYNTVYSCIISIIDKLEKVNNQWWYARISDIVKFFFMKSLIYWYTRGVIGQAGTNDLSRHSVRLFKKYWYYTIQCCPECLKFEILKKLNNFIEKIIFKKFFQSWNW